MKALKEFSLPLKGLSTGVYAYHFDLDRSFFEAIEEAVAEDGKLAVDVELDKKPGMLVFDMTVSGWLATECDRCLAAIHLPMDGEMRLIVKYASEAKQEDDIVYISPEETTFNLAPYVHELIALSIPIMKVYDCESDDPVPCDLKVLEKLDEEVEEREDDDNPWNVLKDIELN